MDGRAQASGIKRPAMDATALLVLNAHHDVVNFSCRRWSAHLALPAGHQHPGRRWRDVPDGR